MARPLGVRVIDHVVVGQDLLVVAVLSPFTVGLYGGTEALAEVGGLGDVDIGVAARQAVGQERYVHGAGGLVDGDGRVSLGRVADAAGGVRHDRRGAES